MRTLLLGLSASALLATAAFAQEPADDTSRLAAADTSAAFSKLDADTDGRVSAIEAASDSKVAAGFTQADMDKDGYLSKAEFQGLGRSMDDSGRAQPRSESMSPDSSAASTPTPQQ